MVTHLVAATLNAMGVDVIDLGLSTTPTVELAVPGEGAQGGIIITASHNPGQWNALKLLNEKGEFISAALGRRLLQMADDVQTEYATMAHIGITTQRHGWIEKHVEMVVNHPLVDRQAIEAAGFKVAVDAVSSSGGIAVPLLLRALGVADVVPLYCEPTGIFPHNPEPLPEHLTDLSAAVVRGGCHLGITVDPDVDRLALVCEDGSMYGEEYTLVTVAHYYMMHKPGPAVSNLSSTRALRDVAHSLGQPYHAAAVGEVNVVETMKAVGATIGGEGNGGIIVPDFHYGRDALIGIGLFLTHLAKAGTTMSALRKSYPEYHMSKNKIELAPAMDVDAILEQVAASYAHCDINRTDGVKIDLPNGWVHLRKSNTEPIIRIYSEAGSPTEAARLATEVMDEIRVAARA
jgi:phosphomannomutase